MARRAPEEAASGFSSLAQPQRTMLSGISAVRKWLCTCDTAEMESPVVNRGISCARRTQSLAEIAGD